MNWIVKQDKGKFIWQGHVFYTFFLTLFIAVIVREGTIVPYYNDRAETIIADWNKGDNEEEWFKDQVETVYLTSVFKVGSARNKHTKENVFYPNEKDKDHWEYVHIRGQNLIHPRKSILWLGKREYIKLHAKVFVDPSIERPYMTYTYLEGDDYFLPGYYNVEVYTNDLGE